MKNYKSLSIDMEREIFHSQNIDELESVLRAQKPTAFTRLVWWVIGESRYVERYISRHITDLQSVQRLTAHLSKKELSQCLCEAAKRSTRDVVAHLIEMGADPHYNHYEPFKAACMRDDADVVQYLVEVAGVNPRHFKQHPAIIYQKREILSYFILHHHLEKEYDCLGPVAQDILHMKKEKQMLEGIALPPKSRKKNKL